MKGRLLALLLSLVVSGAAGLYAKNTAASPTAASAQNAAATVSSESQAGCSSGSAQMTVSSCPSSSAAGTATAAKAVSGSCQSGCTSPSSRYCTQGACGNSGSSCKPAQNGCTASSCASGAASYSCPQNNSCSRSGCGYNSINRYINDILSRFSGKAGNQASSGSKTTSSSKSSSNSSSGASASSGSTATGTYAEYQNQVVQLVNQERTSRGLNALSIDSALTKTATLKSQDMADLGYFDHTSPTYGSPFDMMKQFGISYRVAGENIAMGQTSPKQVMTGWMNSEGHRENILKSSYTKIGVGIAKNSSGRYYWTQQFIG